MVLTQTSPASVSVPDGAGYVGRLTAANAVGAVTTAGALAPGLYSVSGTDADAAGDTGTWSFTLSVNTPSGLPPVGTPVFGHSAPLEPVPGVLRVRLPGATSLCRWAPGRRFRSVRRSIPRPGQCA